jgi:hypothetical protein
VATATPSPRTERAVKLAVLAGMAVLTFPPTFIAYGPGLDAAWVYAVNRAAADGLRFGRDIAFTYGPLGFVACPMDVGNNLAVATVARIALYALWLGAVAALAWPYPARRAAAFALGAVLATAPVYARSPNLELAGAMLCTVAYLLIAAAATGGRWPVVAAGAVAGVALLVKANVGIACGVALAGYAATEAARRGRPGLGRAAVGLGVAGLTAGLLGLPYFGSARAAVGYARDSYLLAEGYSSNMTLYDTFQAVPPAGVAAVAVATAVALGYAARSQPDLIPDVAILAFPLFSLYKSAVVRCDAVHWPPALAHALALLAVFALRGRTRPALAVGLIAATVSAGMLVDAAVNQGFADRAGWGVRAARQLAAWSETRADLATAERTPGSAFVDHFPYASPNREPPNDFPWLSTLDRSARTDVYPHDLIVARDAGLNWRPRYVPQSYAAYHPRLDAASADTYRRPDAPAFVVYQHGSIDNYLPFATNPLTLTELVRWYEPDRRLPPGHLLLRRRSAPALGEPTPVARGVARAGDILPVPAGGPGGVVFLKLGYELDWVGRAAAFAYRVEPPLLRYGFADGNVFDTQVPWRNARSGLPVVPCPPNVADAEAFFGGGPTRASVVTAVMLHPAPGFAPDVPYEWLKAARP